MRNNWDSAYETICSVEGGAKSLIVRFANGDVVEVSCSSLVPARLRLESVRWTDARVESGGLFVAVPAEPEDLEIPWDIIRRLTDLEFARQMVQVAERQSRHIGRRLRELRFARGFTQAEVAHTAGIEPANLSRIENGHSDPSASTLWKLLAALGCSAADLVQDSAVDGEKEGGATGSREAYRAVPSSGSGDTADRERVMARPLSQPSETRPFRIVLLMGGSENWVRHFYVPAIENLMHRVQTRRKPFVTLVWHQDLCGQTKQSAKEFRKLSAWARREGANCLDNSDPESLHEYESLQADVVFLVRPDLSHVDILRDWLDRSKQLIIENPLAASANAVRGLLGELDSQDRSVVLYDQYRARSLLSPTQMVTLLDFLGNGIKALTCYFLEDHSGADIEYMASCATKRDGPIENEHRVASLKHGLISDMMPHVASVLAHFCRIETSLLTRVRAGQYVGVDGDENKRTEIERETFAEVGFCSEDHRGNTVNVSAYIGKGVRGVKALGSQYDHDVKILEVQGVKGNKVRFDLRNSGEGSSRAYFMDSNDRNQFEIPLNPRPHETLLEGLIDGLQLERGLALDVRTEKKIVDLIDDMKYPIPNKNRIPTYPSGMTGGRDSPYLEEVLDHLPLLYGK